MFKSNLFRVVILCLGVALYTSSCSKDDDPKPEPSSVELEVKTVQNQDVSDYGKWYYFSFTTGKVVGEGSANPQDGDDAAWKERTDWDIAFHRNNVRTNGGVSGNGQAEAMALESEDIEAVKEVPEGAFVADVNGEILPEFVMPPEYVESGLNSELNEFAKFEHETMAWSMAKTNVFIVKTADGKYAKLQFVNFLNDKDESGFLTFKYVYQADGTMIFKK